MAARPCRRTPSSAVLLEFFQRQFATGQYSAEIEERTFVWSTPQSDEVLRKRLTYALEGAERSGKHIWFRARCTSPECAGWEGKLRPSQLLHPSSVVHGDKAPLPPVAPDEWADERSLYFADLAKHAVDRQGANARVVVLDGRGRNTLALRNAGVPKRNIFNVDMDPELALWQQMHGMNSLYTNAYLRRPKDPGYIENSILYQSKHPTLVDLYQNTAAIYFDYYGCKHGRFDHVTRWLDTLLPKVEVIGIAQFAAMAACREIVQQPLVIETLPGCCFDGKRRSMRCRFFVKE